MFLVGQKKFWRQISDIFGEISDIFGCFRMFSEFFFNLLSDVPYATEDLYVGEHLFFGRCSSKIEVRRPCPAVGKRATMLWRVRMFVALGAGFFSTIQKVATAIFTCTDVLLYDPNL